MSKTLLVTLLALGVLAAIPGFTAAADSKDDQKAVGALIRSSVGRVLTVLRNKDLPLEEKRKRALKIVDPLIDFPLMAKLTLGREHWKKTAPKQRKSFRDLFTTLLRASYFEKLDLFTDEVVEIEDPVAQGKKYRVVTYIVSKGERTQVVYKLYKKSGVWKVYDLEIEGVSIVKSYGSQYREFLREGTFEELLIRMRAKIKAGSRDPGKGSKEQGPEKKPKPEKRG